MDNPTSAALALAIGVGSAVVLFGLVGWWRFSNGLYRLSEALVKSAEILAERREPKRPTRSV